MGTLRFFEEVVSFKIRRTFGFADYNGTGFRRRPFFLRPLGGGASPNEMASAANTPAVDRMRRLENR